MIARAWFGFWIWLFYALRLRRPWNSVVRWALERNAPRESLAAVRSPGDVALALSGWRWRRDGTRVGGLFVPIDYVSHPEVVQARLLSGESTDGDCDDAHHYAAVQLARCWGVGRVLHISIGYKDGGHLAVVYEYRDCWWLLNYGRVTQLVGGPNSAVGPLLRWAQRPEDERPRWLYFEDPTTLRRVRP